MARQLPLAPSPPDGPRQLTPGGITVPSTRVAAAEQVRVGGGRRGEDRRGGQPGRPRRGPGWGRPGLRRGATVSPSLRPPAAAAAARSPASGAASAASGAAAAAAVTATTPLGTPAGLPFPAASPWRTAVYGHAHGQCVSLHPMLTLAKLPEIFSTKDLALGW